MSRYRADDVNLLLPSFRPHVVKMLELLKARGFDPVPRDTLRTRSEAQANAVKGTGTADSMHCYGVAVDVICGVHGWDCRTAGCPFFEELGEAAESLGLTWGGRWKRGGKGPDRPHVQAILVQHQNALRRLTTDADRDAFVRAHLKTLK